MLKNRSWHLLFLATMFVVICAGGTAMAQADMPGDQAKQANLNHADILLLVQEMLEDRAASWPGEAIINIHPPRLDLEPCGQLNILIAGSGELRPKTSVALRCLGPQPWTAYVQASIQIVGDYFVANKVIQRGDVISMDDLDTRQGDLLRNRRVISDPSHIIGWVATRRIPAGNSIDANAVRDPDSIIRGQQVRTIARGMGFVATGEGQALESGGPGSQIQIRTSSGQNITATVIDAYTVQVMM